MSRHPSSTAELDAAEAAWWADNGDLEADFCWAQTPQVRRLLRRRYLGRMAAEVPAGGHVLELGCGAGWVGIELARMTGCRLVGLDSSPDQLDRARAAARRAGVEDRTTFALGGFATAADGDGPAGACDVVVMHAFLHHLSTAEIRSVLTDSAARLRPGGVALMLEPVSTAGAGGDTVGGPSGRTASRWLALEEKLRILPTWAVHRGLRRMGLQERGIRDRLAGRGLPEPPFGPSPKETPFAAGELEGLLAETGLALEEVRPVMCMSHVVAQELLLAGLSQPRLWRALTRPVLSLARLADSRSLGASERFWTFHLFVARRSAP